MIINGNVLVNVSVMVTSITQYNIEILNNVIAKLGVDKVCYVKRF